MSSISHKFYHLHDVEPQGLLDTYASHFRDKKYIEEIIIFPLKATYKMLQSGRIKGDTLIDLSTGPCMFHLIPICNFFKHIIILEFNSSCMKALQKWLHKEPGALDWSHLSEIAADLEGISVKPEKMEEDLRKRVKHILKCDITKDNLTDPVILRDADCVFSFHLLEHISENLDAYQVNLRKISPMLKIGASLLLVTAFNATHYSVAEHKYHIMNYNEADLRHALQNTGFSVEYLEAVESKIRDDTAYCHHVAFVCAVKRREI